MMWLNATCQSSHATTRLPSDYSRCTYAPHTYLSLAPAVLPDNASRVIPKTGSGNRAKRRQRHLKDEDQSSMGGGQLPKGALEDVLDTCAHPSPLSGLPLWSHLHHPSRRAVAKPKRRRPAFCSIEDSSQDEHFQALKAALPKTDSIYYQALEYLKEGVDLLAVWGPNDDAPLLQGQWQLVGSGVVQGYALVFEPLWSPLTWQYERTTYRWDPPLHARATGDATVQCAPPRERKRMTEAIGAESGRRRDRLLMHLESVDAAPRRVAGLPPALIESVLERHGRGRMRLKEEQP